MKKKLQVHRADLKANIHLESLRETLKSLKFEKEFLAIMVYMDSI